MLIELVTIYSEIPSESTKATEVKAIVKTPEANDKLLSANAQESLANSPTPLAIDTTVKKDFPWLFLFSTSAVTISASAGAMFKSAGAVFKRACDMFSSAGVMFKSAVAIFAPDEKSCHQDTKIFLL
jgi:hypothetical protein